MHTTYSHTQYTNESKHSEMGPVRQNLTILTKQHRKQKNKHNKLNPGVCKLSSGNCAVRLAFFRPYGSENP